MSEDFKRKIVEWFIVKYIEDEEKKRELFKNLKEAPTFKREESKCQKKPKENY